MKLSEHSCVLLGILLSYSFVETQINTGDDPNNLNAVNNLFFFDSNSDCNGPMRNLYGLQGTIRGSDLSSLRLGPNKCMIRLTSEQQFDGISLDIEIKAMNILDCQTQVAIYDGDGEVLLLMSYDCHSNLYMNRRRFYTSGNTATFVMTRQNVNSYSFDVEITVNPVRVAQDPNYENNYGKDNPYAFDKFPQMYIVIMLAIVYIIVIAICLIVVFCKWRFFMSLNKKWEAHQLATFKSGSRLDVRSQGTQPSQIATLDTAKSRGPASQYSRATTQPAARKAGAPSEDVDNQQKRRLVNEQQESAQPNYTNSVYSEPEDAPEEFREKIIIPTKHKNGNRRPPPSYNEAVSHNASASSSEEESDASSKNSSVRKMQPSSEEEDSERSSRRSSVRSSERSRSTGRTRSTRTVTPSESESEEESNDGSSSRHQARALRGKSKQKRQPAPKRSQIPIQPAPQMQQPPKHPPMYGGYPPGQFVPMMAGATPFQPITMAGYPPPHYPVQPPVPRGPQVQGTDIPVYSYLVQRGYRPIDAASASQASSDNSQRSRGLKQEEPDMRLDCGVDYMKR